HTRSDRDWSSDVCSSDLSAQDLTQRLPLRGTSDELDHLAETLNAMFARLDAAFTHIRRFAVDAAHELRTPLTVLKGGIEVALRRSEERRVGKEWRAGGSW